MRALLYADFGTLTEVELPDPAPAADEVVIRVAACGICGSELESFRKRSRRRIPPLVLGHEFCGVVEETGIEVRGVAIGDRVVANALVSCGTCPRCRRGDDHLCTKRQLFGMHRPGAFAERVAAPAQCLVQWPKTVPAASACLAEPLANGIHLVGLVKSRDMNAVVIIGAGPIGILTLQAFLAETTANIVVSDINDDRLAVVSRLGNKRAIAVRAENLASAVDGMTEGEGAGVVIDAVGSERTKSQSIELARDGGVVVWIGLGEDTVRLSTHAITVREVSILGSYGGRLSELRRAVELLASGAVETRPWVTTAPMDGGAKLFHRMLAAQGSDIKGVIVP